MNRPNYISKDDARTVNPVPSGWSGALPEFGTNQGRMYSINEIREKLLKKLPEMWVKELVEYLSETTSDKKT